MAPTHAPTVDALTVMACGRARAEARELEAMLAYRDAEIARTESVQPPMRRQVERAAIALTIAEAVGLSEAQVVLRLSWGARVRDHAPRAWSAFGTGQIDWARVREIARTLDLLQRPQSWALLDDQVVGYAVGHTAAELRRWLRRFTQRLEADLAAERAESERRNRHVTITHVDDGMAWLNAYVPSHQAAAVERRLHDGARTTTTTGDDDRTVGQHQADLLVAWCTNSETTQPAVDTHIAVMIDADVLAAST